MSQKLYYFAHTYVYVHGTAESEGKMSLVSLTLYNTILPHTAQSYLFPAAL